MKAVVVQDLPTTKDVVGSKLEREESVGKHALDVAVVGGGIGGLFAANALQKQGISATVYEQASALSEIGAGVQLTPNSVRQLERLGFGPDVERLGAPVGSNSRYMRDDRTLIGPVITTDSSGWNAVLGMHRADLVEILASGLAPGTIKCDHRCVGFEQDEHSTRLTFANGEIVDANVTVGADGIHSMLAQQLGQTSAPVFSGSVSYRGLVEHRAVPDCPNDSFLLWMGERKHFMVYPVRGGKLLNYVGFLPSAKEFSESWSAPGDARVLAQEFSAWDPILDQLIGQIDEIFGWGLYDREPLARWTTGRMALLGDAAHPMLPHLGQGANQAIEDGMALATILAGAPGQPSRALLAYETLRRDRTQEIQRGARANGLRYDSAYEDLKSRDLEMAAMQRFRYWLYDYDVLADAEHIMQDLNAEQVK
jgi:salicylate hydroxylase